MHPLYSLGSSMSGVTQRPLLRRTRINVKQSKNGCFTCKSRRLKCDETKPTCLRCDRSRKLCQGYPDVPSESSWRLRKSADGRDEVACGNRLPRSVTNPLSVSQISNRDQSHWSSLGIDVISHAGYGVSLIPAGDVWRCLLSQLNLRSRTVNAAISALGAVYDSIFLRRGQHRSRSDALELTQDALRSLRNEMSRHDHEATPLFCASVMLAATEIMLRHYSNALTHLNGLHSMLRQSHYSQAIDDFGLYSVAQALDLQAASFILSSPTHLPSVSVSDLESVPPPDFDMQQASKYLIPLLHSSYDFIGHSSHRQGLPASSIPTELLVTRDRYVAVINRWLDLLTISISTPSSSSSSSSGQKRRQILTFQTQLLTAKIYISTLLSPSELAYDAHASSFERILNACTEILLPLLPRPPKNPRHHDPTPQKPASGPTSTSTSTSTGTRSHHFCLLPGLAPSLLQTAMKYRQPRQRRRAIGLLGLLATEGPWDPRVLITVARRAVMMEETGRPYASELPTKPLSKPSPWPGSPTPVSAGRLDHADHETETETETAVQLRSSHAPPEHHRLHGIGMRSRTGHQFVTPPTAVTVSRAGKVECVSVREYWYEERDHWTLWAEVVAEL